jgi:hypothetical protein
MVNTELNWLRIRTRGRFCEDVNEPLGCNKSAEFFAQLSDCQPVKKDSTPWSYNY